MLSICKRRARQTPLLYEAMSQLMPALTFRIATIDDADLLLAWRNDPDTRANSHTTGVVTREAHVAWLSTALADPQRAIRIAELDGVAVGTIRLDQAGDHYELSWTIAPSARGKGIGKAMLKATLTQLDKPAHAEIKAGNPASQHIAQHAGMTLAREENSIFYYRT